MKQVTVKGKTYRSVVAAWRELSPPDLKLTTVRWRLRTGWSPDEAFTCDPVIPVLRRMFKRLRLTTGEKV